MKIFREEIIHHILTEAPDIHKTYSVEDGFCALTDKRGSRYVIDESYSLDEVIQLLNQIKKANETIYARIDRQRTVNDFTGECS